MVCDEPFVHQPRILSLPKPMNRRIRRTVAVGREPVATEDVAVEAAEAEEEAEAAAVSAVDQNTKSYVRDGIPKSEIDATTMRTILFMGITFKHAWIARRKDGSHATNMADWTILVLGSGDPGPMRGLATKKFG